MSDENYLLQMENLFLALADKTRLRILNLMREDEICVYFFTEVLGESQPKISRHLAYLKNAGVVSARREGKWIHYQIEAPGNLFAAKILQDTLDWLKSQNDMQSDYEKLISICCSAKAPTIINSDASIETRKSFEKRDKLEIYLL
jgi:ArsR family transcriptional regulator